MDALEDDAFETWRRLRLARGESVTAIELYELVARSRGIKPEQLPVEERRELGFRALRVMDARFEYTPGSDSPNPSRSSWRLTTPAGPPSSTAGSKSCWRPCPRRPVPANEGVGGGALGRRPPRLHRGQGRDDPASHRRRRGLGEPGRLEPAG